LVHTEARYVLTIKNDLSLVGTQQARQQVDERTFACAIWPDKGVNLAMINIKANVVGGAQAMEMLDQISRREQAHVNLRINIGRPILPIRCLFRPKSELKPLGATRIMMITSKPIGQCQYSVNCGKNSFKRLHSTTPTMGPHLLPMPPSATITINSAECVQ